MGFRFHIKINWKVYEIIKTIKFQLRGRELFKNTELYINLIAPIHLKFRHNKFKLFNASVIFVNESFLSSTSGLLAFIKLCVMLLRY